MIRYGAARVAITTIDTISIYLNNYPVLLNFSLSYAYAEY